MYSCQTAKRLREMAIRPRIVLRPDRVPVRPIGGATAIATKADLWIHQTRESELSLLLPIRRPREILVLDSWVLAKRALPGIGDADENDANSKPPKSRSPSHRSVPREYHLDLPIR